MRKQRRAGRAIGIGVGAALLTSISVLVGPIASAAPHGLPSITLRAPEPGTYPRTTGGGTWGDGRGLMPSLAPRPAACGDVVSVLVAIDAPGDAEPNDVTVVLSMLPEMTGQPGAGLVPIEGGVGLTVADPGVRSDGASAVRDVVHTLAADPTARGARSRTTFTVTDVEAGERIVVRVDTRVVCSGVSRPTGVLQIAVDAASTAIAVIPVGRQTIPIKVDATTTTTTTTSSTTSTTTTTTTPTTTTTTAPAIAGEVLGVPDALRAGAAGAGASPGRARTARAASCSRGASASGTTTSGTIPAEVCGAQLARSAEVGNASLATTGSEGPIVLAALGALLAVLGLAAVRRARRVVG